MEQAQDFAASLNATLFETSAKTNQGVEELFLDLSTKLLQRAEGDCPLESSPVLCLLYFWNILYPLSFSFG
jgi:GTPase SAR1 family protein